MIDNDFLSSIKRGVKEIIPAGELEKKLKEKKKLRIKYGIDPTAPDIHLGHTVLLHKLRQFQDYGHQVIFLIGDFTARIGDPSGRSETRKPLSEEEIKENYENYRKHISRILDMDRLEVVFNSSWLTPLGVNGLFDLASRYTVARMLERNDFSKRYAAGVPISIIEFLYPLLQGYDSVHLKADIEVGGEDQLFNLLVGRELQKEYGQDCQVVMTMPLLVGLDGKMKMSKSYNNYIGITDPPTEMFGKIMSVPDNIMLDYYTLLTDKNLEEVKKMHPKTAKETLGGIIVERYHGKEAAVSARENFNKVFAAGGLPEDIKVFFAGREKITVMEAILLSCSIESKKEIRRLILQSAVEVNGKKISGPEEVLELSSGPLVFKVGKRNFFKIEK